MLYTPDGATLKRFAKMQAKFKLVVVFLDGSTSITQHASEREAMLHYENNFRYGKKTVADYWTEEI